MIFYNEKGYTSGLVLSFENEKDSNDRVLIVAHGYNSGVDMFLLEAQKNNRWSKFLIIDSNL